MTTYSHFIKCDQVAMSRAFRPTLGGSMAPIPNLYAKNPWPRTRPDILSWPTYYNPSSQLICPMDYPPVTAPSGTAASWHHTSEITHTRRCLAVSTTVAMIPFKLHVLPLMRYPLRSFLRLPLYSGLHFRSIPCSVRYLLQLALHSLTLVRPYRCGTEIFLFASWRNLSVLHLYQLLLQKDAKLLVVSEGCAIYDYGSFGWILGTAHKVLWGYKGIARGYVMYSFRAKGYGCISLTSF
jgi:hypothetical protein